MLKMLSGVTSASVRQGVRFMVPSPDRMSLTSMVTITDISQFRPENVKFLAGRYDENAPKSVRINVSDDIPTIYFGFIRPGDVGNGKLCYFARVFVRLTVQGWVIRLSPQ